MTRFATWWQSGERPSIGTVAFGFLLLSMTALSIISAIAFHNINTQRARTADEAIREYASLGARLFGDRAFGLFEGTRLRILGAAYGRRLRAGEALPAFTHFVEDATREMDQMGFAVGDANRGFFVVDERSGRFSATGAAARDGMESRIRTMLRESPPPQERRMEPMVWLLGDLPDKLSVGYTALRDVAGDTRAWYGFTYTRDAGWKSVGDAVMAGIPLLPGRIIEADVRSGLDMARSDTLIAVRVVGAAGEVLYESRPAFAGSPQGDFAFSAGTSSLDMQTTLHPALVAELRRTLRAGSARIYWEWARAGDVAPRRIPIPMETLLPIVAALLAILAGIGLWRERQLAGARRDFVASVSHELRTPLSQIRMFTETLLLRRERDEEERVKWLGIVSRESRRLGDLVENILLFSHIDAERARIEKERTDLGELVEEVVESYVPVAAQKGMRLVADAPSRIFALVDPRAMRQVVVNLLDNALKYGPSGQVVVLELERVDGVACLVVRDQGPGIAVGDRKRIWEPFVRLGTKATTGGSGIGLAVVKDLVEMHGGTIEVDDAAGGGARFTVTLPISETADGLPLRATGEFRAREAAAVRATASEVRPEG